MLVKMVKVKKEKLTFRVSENLKARWNSLEKTLLEKGLGLDHEQIIFEIVRKLELESRKNHEVEI